MSNGIVKGTEGGTIYGPARVMLAPLFASTVITTLVIVSAAVLAALHDINGQVVATLLGAVIGHAGHGLATRTSPRIIGPSDYGNGGKG
jgi:hypothetical protein